MNGPPGSGEAARILNKSEAALGTEQASAPIIGDAADARKCVKALPKVRA